jgi:carbonic anhydrase
MSKKTPKTLFICCCDNRIIPHIFSPTEQDELFVLRNIGNIIPPYEKKEHSVMAAIEFAMEHVHIKEVILCGHSDCGGMKAKFAGLNKETSLGKWLEYGHETKNISCPEELSKQNVLRQIEHLKKYPYVAKKLLKNKVTIHAWWLDLVTDIIDIYDREKKSWISKNKLSL